MINKMRLFFFCLFVTLFSHSFATTMYAFILGDTDALDIKKSIEVDMQNVSEQVRVISKMIGVPLVEKNIKTNECGEDFFEIFRKQPIKSDDIVIFYYAGHGFHPREDVENPWPSFYLSRKRTSINYKDIMEEIEAKKPRFILTLADCCNNYVNMKVPKIKRRELRFPRVQKIQENYKKLFLEFSGKICISGCSLDEFSACSKKIGGYYTSSFIKSLTSEIETGKRVSWENVVSGAEVNLKTILFGTSKQTPYVEMNIKYDDH